ncbi:chemotaxis protein CheB [Dictyobacter sp. S3.2.2.5]|uniref:protein-glutamate methylesterase n=1 Tax=Dictyobacter halimunensis TaxID=3026934 RepID=A0ABQ6FPK6_9CHLR|nr:chemotaxis protein CheB [Dictyobacter sp. S3.2.2.5]
MAGQDIVVVGASAGGVEALMTLVSGLPRNLSAALFVALHLSSDGPSRLPEILSRAGVLPAVHPADGEPIEYGKIYVAPPDYHLLLERGCVKLIRGPKENRNRPAIDPLFRSAAHAYGRRAAGVILTGGLDDGTSGLFTIKQKRGLAVVQDPQEALYSSMPRSALAHVDVDYVLPLHEIAPLLTRLANEHRDGEDLRATDPSQDECQAEDKVTNMENNDLQREELKGDPSAFSCPECGGVLWEMKNGTLQRFRCRVGHAFSAESMLVEQSEELDKALWMALKTMEEKAELLQRMRDNAHQHSNSWLAQSLETRFVEAQRHSQTLRQLLVEGGLKLSEPGFDQELQVPPSRE